MHNPLPPKRRRDFEPAILRASVSPRLGKRMEGEVVDGLNQISDIDKLILKSTYSNTFFPLYFLFHFHINIFIRQKCT